MGAVLLAGGPPMAPFPAVATIGIRHLPLAASRKRYIRLARRRKGASFFSCDRCSACESAGEAQKFAPVRSSLGESRPCLFSLLELLSSPSQCLPRLFLAQLLYPSSQNCCAAQKA